MAVTGFGYKSTSPKTILGANLTQWQRSDHGCTIVTGVSQWSDLSGGANHFAQATGGAQPVWGATAGPNGTPALTFDGIDDAMLASTPTRASPGTTPLWVWIVTKQITWSNNERFFSSGNSSSQICLVQTGGSPGIATYNGLTSNVNNGLAVGAWGAVQVYFSNTTADYIQVNDLTPTTGINTGNNGLQVGMWLGSGNGTLFGNIAVSEFATANVLPSPSQLAMLSAYRLARYGF